MHLAAALVFFVLGVPWYFTNNSLYLVFGLPLWVITSIVVSVLFSIYLVWVIHIWWDDFEGSGK